MPTYEYKCPECSYSGLVFHKMNDETGLNCFLCYSKGIDIKMQKGFGGGIGIHFKGSGFYETDYKGK